MATTFSYLLQTTLFLKRNQLKPSLLTEGDEPRQIEEIEAQKLETKKSYVGVDCMLHVVQNCGWNMTADSLLFSQTFPNSASFLRAEWMTKVSDSSSRGSFLVSL